MLRFVGSGDQKKKSPKIPAIFNAKFPGKFEEKIHKSFLESGQSDRKTLKRRNTKKYAKLTKSSIFGLALKTRKTYRKITKTARK